MDNYKVTDIISEQQRCNISTNNFQVLNKHHCMENNITPSAEYTNISKIESEHLKRIVEVLIRLEERMVDHEHEEQVKAEWMIVAMVLDRFLLIVFALLTVSVSMGILLFRPDESVQRKIV